jgi:hypothetical protein
MFAGLRRLASKFFTLADKELSVLEELHGDVLATVARFAAHDAGFEQLVRGAYAYAVFPSVGKAAAVVGAAFGKGEVFQGKQMIGYAALAQMSVGVQLGGHTFDEVIIFRNEAALKRFKAGRFAFAADASAVVVKAGAAAASDYEHAAGVFVLSEGGLMLELSIGTQKFMFRPAVLGRGARGAAGQKRTGKSSDVDRRPTRNRTRQHRPRNSGPGSTEHGKPARTRRRKASGATGTRT